MLKSLMLRMCSLPVNEVEGSQSQVSKTGLHFHRPVKDHGYRLGLRVKMSCLGYSRKLLVSWFKICCNFLLLFL